MRKQARQTTHKAPDNTAQAKAIAHEAYLFGLPLVYIQMGNDSQTHVTRPQGDFAPVNQFGHHRKFPDAKNNPVVGMNVDTLYSFGILDLGKEPIVLSVPPMGERFWIMQVIDGWNDVPSAPGARSAGGKGGNWVVVGPHWSGSLPETMQVIRVATGQAMIAGRIYTSGGSDYAKVHELQDQLKLTPLSKWGAHYQPPPDVPLKPGVDAKTPIPKQVFALSAQDFFSRLAMLLPDNPAHGADAAVLERMEMLGIVPGEPVDFTGFDDATREAIEAGVKDAQQEILAGHDKMGEVVNGWQIARDLGRYAARYSYRAIWTYFAVGGNLVEDAFYPTTQVDSTGQKLTGAHRYRLHFTKDEIPPVDAFWSLTLYDEHSFLVPNAIDRYSLSNRDPMKSDPDGSLTIYIQKNDPGGEASANWLPAPEGAIFLALRLYSPKKVVADGKWAPPAVQRVD